MPRFFLSALCCLCTLGAAHLSAQTHTVAGIVRDASGAVIARADVRLSAGTIQADTKTSTDGSYSFPNVREDSGTVEVRADGFVPANRNWTSADSTLHLDLTLQPSPVRQQVTVSAARTEIPLSETPGSTILFSTPAIAAIPALRVDDMLRQAPGFSLFRRSGSRAANPSSEGVSLRGLGGTAASRALVLADGIPLIDPFGGWVNWDRIPRMALANVEVFRGGTSNLYGSDALGGVVSFNSRQPEAPAINLDATYGNQNTADLSLWTGTRSGPWDLSLASELFRTDGYILVPNDVRGSVDTPANSKNATVYALIGHQLGANGRVFLRGNYYTDSRNNGTQLQTNDTSLGEGAAGLDQHFGANDSVAVRFYGDVEGYDQSFSAISADRNSETLTDLQHVAEQVVGGSAQWTHVLGSHQTLIGGLDLSEIIGTSADQLRTGPNRSRTGGGRQRILGLYGEDVIRIQKWTILLAARFDDWNNFRASLATVPVSGPEAIIHYPDRSENAFSPRLSLVRSINNHLSLTASVYRAFRAPTLNELYRTFRVGNVLTFNNAFLNAERLTGTEAGFTVKTWTDRLNLRGTFFWSQIVNPVANVTLTSTPTLITRQKENLGRTQSLGTEIDGELRISSTIHLNAGYAYTDATVVSYPGNPGGVDLNGLDVPQVPHHIFTFQARYWNPSRIMLSTTGRYVSRQFDDDQNQFPLDGFYTMDVQAGRNLTRHLELFAAIENVFNQRYQVANTPVLNLGPPILVRGGVRVNFPAAQY